MYVAIRDALLPSWGCADPVAALRALGLSAVEVEVDRNLAIPGFGAPQSLRDAAARDAFAKSVAESGVRVASFLMHNDFSSDVGKEATWVVEVAVLAAQLGVPTVRVDLAPHSPMETNEFVERALQGMKLAIAQSPAGVRFAVENHGHVTNDRAVLERLLSELDGASFGLTMDTGNFYWYGLPLEEVYALLEWVAPRTYHTHLKNIRYPADRVNVLRPMGWEYEKYVSPLADGDIDHGRVVSILKAAGYAGPLTIEDESLGQYPVEGRLALLKADADYVKGLL